MMKSYVQSVKINKNLNLPYIPDCSYRILIIGGSESSKTNVLLSLIKSQGTDIHKIYLYIKDPFQSKCQLLSNGREKVGMEKWKYSKVFINYSQTIVHVYENLEE